MDIYWQPVRCFCSLRAAIVATYTLIYTNTDTDTHTHISTRTNPHSNTRIYPGNNNSHRRDDLIFPDKNRPFDIFAELNHSWTTCITSMFHSTGIDNHKICQIITNSTHQIRFDAPSESKHQSISLTLNRTQRKWKWIWAPLTFCVEQPVCPKLPDFCVFFSFFFYPPFIPT